MLVAAYVLPWITGAIWLIWLESFSDQISIINWPRALGYGFFLGNFICAAALYTVQALLGQLSVSLVTGGMAGLSLLGIILTWHRYRRQRREFVAPYTPIDRKINWLSILLLVLIILHLTLAATDVLSRPLLPWDAWTTWTYRAKIWFLNQELSPMVSPENWLSTTDPGTYTITAFFYPPVVSLIQLWPVQVYGAWNDSLAILPGMLAGIAIALGLYGQGRSLGWPSLMMLAAVYMLLSLPLLDAHLALPGYADLWLSGFAGLGFVALLQWTQSSDKSQLLLGLFFLLLGMMIKREGVLWGMVGILFVIVYLSPWRLLLALAAGLVLAVVSGHSSLELPILGRLGYADGVFYLAQLGVFPLQLQDASAALATNLFFHASWNLLYFYLSAALLLLLLPVCAGIRSTVLWFVLLISVVITFMFFLSEEGRWLRDNTAFNRIVLQVSPALLFSLMMTWRVFAAYLSRPEGSARP
jgi:hypothetical protein